MRPSNSQKYFRTKEWQAGERKAEEDIRKGRTKGFESVKKLMDDLRDVNHVARHSMSLE